MAHETLRIFNGNVKATIHTDREAWDLHTATTKRLSEAVSPARVAIATVDYQNTFYMCVRRDLLVEPYPVEEL